METGDLVLGGEQSGHVIFRDLATTGDGILTGIQLLDCVRRAGRPLSALAAQMTREPQLLEGVRVAAKPDLTAAPGLAAEIAAVEADLGAGGRVLVRASGTEPLIRIMVEAPTEDGARRALSRLRAATEKEFGAPGGGR
jgi:phosphoglucosamine mutase